MTKNEWVKQRKFTLFLLGDSCLLGVFGDLATLGLIGDLAGFGDLFNE